MSVTDIAAPASPPSPSLPSRVLAGFNRSSSTRLLAAGGVLLVLLATTRVITDAEDLTSSGTIGTALRVTIPILMAGMAGLWAERCGIVNIGIEGMMIFGTWFGAYGAWQWGPWQGLVLGIAGGAMAGILHAVATVRFNIDHIISGVAINLLGFFGTRYLAELAFVGEQGGGISQSPPQKAPIPRFNFPLLSGGEVLGWRSPDMLGWLEDHRWFAISDVAGIVRGATFNVSWATILCLLLVPLSTWVLWRTQFGLRVRSSGEAPAAAESLGVKIVRLRYAALAVSGGFAGLGGAFLSIVSSSYYRQGQTAGRGFIGLATTIFGNWRPSGVLGGAALFGFSEALQLRGPELVTSLLLFVSFAAGLLMVLSMVRRKVVSSVVGFVAAALFLVAYRTVDEVPQSLVLATPYVVTLVVLATASQRLRPPMFAGQIYRSGDGH